MFAPRQSGMTARTVGKSHDRVTFAPTPKRDENATVLHAKNLHQTPQSSSKHKSKIPQPSQQKRRALGDISNKKKPLGDAHSQAGASKPGLASPSMSQLWKQNDSVTPRRLPLQQRPRNQKVSPSPFSMKPAGMGDSGANHVRSGVVDLETSSIPRSSGLKPKGRTVGFTLPRSNAKSLTPKQTLPKQKMTGHVAPKTKAENGELLKPVDDVEYPAGRLWSEQVELEADDDDSFQAAYKEGMEELTTMWDDWRYIMVDQLKERRRAEQEENAKTDAAFEEELFEKYKLVLDEDEKGLDTLLDYVDDIDDIDCDRYLDADGADDWSDPASSILGDTSFIF